jgi:hypothetical protein
VDFQAIQPAQEERNIVTRGHFVAWVGTYEDIYREGQENRKTLHSVPNPKLQ